MKLGDCEFSQITTVKGHHNKSKRLLQRQKPLGWMGLLLIEKVLANQHLHQLVPVDLADHAAGIVVVGDVGGVFGNDVAHQLIDGVVALYQQRVIYRGKNFFDLGLLIQRCKLSGLVFHQYTSFKLYGCDRLALSYSKIPAL